jgi:serine/threonine protein kinase/Tfp pilus assembly protein PilF
MNGADEFTPTLVVPGLGPQRDEDAAKARPEAIRSADASDAEPAPLPAIGTTFLGFHLLAVLGRGAFGQVYLAEQPELASRFVALKVAPDIFGESQTLAQLQHTNIVPIYSLHRQGRLQAVCMPYFGATTLADVLYEVKARQARSMTGRTVVETVEQRKRSTVPVLESGQARVPSTGSAAPASDLPAVARSGAHAASALRQLEAMSYVEAVLWLAERIADGLAHAHEQGILHHDLKPANILLTEDGQPMLLDFNLSEDTKRRADSETALVGGTLPYMAPEHLDLFRARGLQLDARSDLFALGVILYELLSGRLPFPTYSRMSRETLTRMIEDRHGAPPALRTLNPAVTPAVAAIVDHCLHPDPARRYQSARQLQEDLKRHRCDLPLRHARERSAIERARKWVRRHPRLTSSSSVGAMLAVVLGLVVSGFHMREEQLARLEAQETLAQFRAEARTVQFLLYSRHADRAQLSEGMDHCKAALAHFAILDHADWLAAPAVHNLPADEQANLRAEAGEILFLLARATALEAQASGRSERFAEADRINRAAERAFGTENAPRALWEQRAEIARLRGDAEAAARARQEAAAVPLRSTRDRYLVAHQEASGGSLKLALEMLEEVTQEDPAYFSAWFVRGKCAYDLAQDGNAIACYNACVTLRPEFHWTWYNRGLAHLRLRQYGPALRDFERVIALQPDLPDGYLHRALAREGLHQDQGAEADYTQALAKPTASTRIYFLRSAARARLGDHAGAQGDLERGLTTEPNDVDGWITRGSVRRERDPDGALADYDRALQLNPRSFEALQNKAALLSDKFRDDAGALQILEQAVRLYPESVLSRGGRGVLLARAGRRDAALEDAKACLVIDRGPATQYQVACIYALTARQHGPDRLQAMPLLSAALRGGFGLEFVDRDTDLDTLRPLPEFARVLEAARVLDLQRQGANEGVP